MAKKRGRQPNLTEEEVKKIVRAVKKNFLIEREKTLPKKS